MKIGFSKAKFKPKSKGLKPFRLSKLRYNWNENFYSKHNWNTVEMKIFTEGESEIQSNTNTIQIEMLKATQR
jgi:hypothetical protein